MTRNQKLIATGDDYGLVCLFRNPAREGHESSKFMGHSEHVTTVKFSQNGDYLWSAGGQDQTVIQWKVGKKPKEDEDSD